MALRFLKALQLVVAIATTLLLGAGLVPPDPVVSFLLVPFGVLYVFWAIRCLYDRRWSIWLACVSTIMVAIVMSALGGAMTHSALSSHRYYPAVAVDATGAVVALPPGALPAMEHSQTLSERHARAHAAILLLVAAGAWVVLILCAFEWRWAFTRNNRK
jgi:hypothetical protein